MPDKWTMDPSFPVVFDIATNEYAVLHGPNQRAQAVMRYCFWCGGALPESKRDTFFTAPDPAEVTAMKRILARVSDARSMRDVLGEPDSTDDWPRDEYHRQQAEIYGIERWERQYTYTSRWRTLCVTITEKADGSVTYAFSGKAKGGSDQPAA